MHTDAVSYRGQFAGTAHALTGLGVRKCFLKSRGGPSSGSSPGARTGE